MSNIVDFSKRKAKTKVTKKHEPMTLQTFNEWAEEDIQKLMKATQQSHEDAIKMASDFYRQYPMLIELVRSPEFMAER